MFIFSADSVERARLRPSRFAEWCSIAFIIWGIIFWTLRLSGNLERSDPVMLFKGLYFLGFYGGLGVLYFWPRWSFDKKLGTVQHARLIRRPEVWQLIDVVRVEWHLDPMVCFRRYQGTHFVLILRDDSRLVIQHSDIWRGRVVHNARQVAAFLGVPCCEV